MIRACLVALTAIIAIQPAREWHPSFEQVQPELFSAPGGNANAWADADNDGDLDYFVGFRGRPNRFYRNDRGRFVDVAADVGLADHHETRAVAWGDYDADGHVDLYVGFADPKLRSKVYRNAGNGKRFADVAGEIGLTLNGVSHPPQRQRRMVGFRSRWRSRSVRGQPGRRRQRPVSAGQRPL